MKYDDDKPLYAILVGGDMEGEWCLCDWTKDPEAAVRRAETIKRVCKRVKLFREVLPEAKP